MLAASRRSTASSVPVDAPAGAMARPAPRFSDGSPLQPSAASRIPHPATDDCLNQIALCGTVTIGRCLPDRPAHARRTPSSLSTGCISIDRAKRRIPCFSRRHQSDIRQAICRRLAPGRAPAASGQHAAAASPAAPNRRHRSYAAVIASNDVSSSRLTDGTHNVFNSRWFRQKAKLECRVAEPGTLGVEEDRSAARPTRCSSG